MFESAELGHTIDKERYQLEEPELRKFWLQISKEEQLRRFKEREATSFKQHKITSEDWRNREKWDAYNVAVCEMIDRTSTELAPWTLVEANDKYSARLKVIGRIADAL